MAYETRRNRYCIQTSAEMKPPFRRERLRGWRKKGLKVHFFGGSGTVSTLLFYPKKYQFSSASSYKNPKIYILRGLFKVL